MQDKKHPERILYTMPQTYGDLFVSTGVIDGIKKKFPNADVYVATESKYASILEGNPQIKAIIEYHDSMLNYRAYESFANQQGIFDMVFCPFIVTQRIPMWIHGGFGEWLGRVYANMCHVEYGQQFIKLDFSVLENLPKKYITVHSQAGQDPKNYDYINDLVNKIKNIKVVQIGGRTDKDIDKDNVIDMRGCTWQQSAAILKNSNLHIGHDSCLMHIAGHLGTPSVILFGGTYAKQGMAPHYFPHIRAIETQDRGPCITSCHLIECEAKKHGYEKCINNIPLDDVIEVITEVLGPDYIEQPEPIKLSAYMIIKDGIKYGFPFEESIAAAEKICDEVVVVDGGSTDGTYELLLRLAAERVEQGKNLQPILSLKVCQHEWDLDNPTLFGDEKTYARQQCSGNWLIQLDADEMIQEPYPGAIRETIKKNRNTDVLDLPIINFYGDTETIRIEDQCWKWRISKNDPKIVHGVHAEARIFDTETMKITMDKKISDSAEYIYVDDLKIAKHKPIFPIKLAAMHEALKRGQISSEEYLKELKNVIENYPIVFHASWLNLNRKLKNSEFWNQTWHAKKSWTHNCSKDIEERVENKSKEILLKVNFKHPFEKIHEA